MLTRLSIRDFAVVAHAELAFAPGMTVISGETGAGKSLLVDALGFLTGARADSTAVRHGAQRAELEAEFELTDVPHAATWLQDNELDDGATCLLRRTLRADGGSKAWINGRAATVAQLDALAATLLAIHGQHAQQALLARPHQLALVDGYGGHADTLAQVAAAARTWQTLAHERDALLGKGPPDDRRAWLAHQLRELDEHPVEPAHIADLEAQHRRQAHATGLIAAFEAALEALAGDDGLAGRARGLQGLLQRERDHEPRLSEVDTMLDAAAIQLEEASTLLERLRADLDIDPQALADSERQLSRLHDLARKHRVPLEQLAAQRAMLAAELESLEAAQLRLQRLQPAMDQAAQDWQAAASRLTAQRQAAATRLAAEVEGLIDTLGMPGGRFQVQWQAIEGNVPDASGRERAEFLVSANPGQPPAPLRKIASGGELSRLSLAVEVATRALGSMPTLVFDEVDAGIGGAVAAAVGARLHALAAHCQVLCVTHQPQVAAAGDAHYRVSKAARGGITQSAVVPLDAPGRVEEIARMLGGAQVTDAARAAAEQLLQP